MSSEIPVIKIEFGNGAIGLYEVIGTAFGDISCRSMDAQMRLIGVSAGDRFTDLSGQPLKPVICTKVTALRGVLSHPALAPLFAEREAAEAAETEPASAAVS